MSKLILIVLLTCLYLSPGLQAGNGDESATPDAPFPVPQSVHFLMGDLTAEETAGELGHPSADFSWGIGVSYAHRDYWDMRYELMMVEAEYNTPATLSGGPFTNISDDMHLTSMGLSVMPVFKMSLNDIDLYAGLGLGMFWSKLTLTASTLGIPGTHEEKSSATGYQTLAGLGYNFSDSFIAIEYRQLDLQANLAPVTSNANHDVGGEMLMVIYQLSF